MDRVVDNGARVLIILYLSAVVPSSGFSKCCFGASFLTFQIIRLTLLDKQGKAKFNAWKKVADDKTTPEDAQKKYVELVEKLKGVYGFEA
jgi:hypothetical protein